MAVQLKKWTLDPAFPKHLADIVDDMLEKVGDDILADAKRYAPVRTGHLKQSLVAEVEDGELRVGSVGCDYAMDVEFGTAPHIIEPRTKKALSWPGAAHPVNRVLHPGTRAHPYLRPALYTQRAVS
ncbi:HK97 gp10 family phage protein [Streptomyces sp. NPDC056291]|uniref:HK97 gp10 family phage protein n=1 Tax=Streptomyces sp. NPDC056291 TaxID=3345772 RepID=UPI0035D73B08